MIDINIKFDFECKSCGDSLDAFYVDMEDGVCLVEVDVCEECLFMEYSKGYDDGEENRKLAKGS